MDLRQKKIPAIFRKLIFWDPFQKKIDEKTPLFIFTKSKHFLETQIFEILQKSCRKVAEKLRELIISKQNGLIL